MNRTLPLINDRTVPTRAIRPLRVALVVMPFASTLAPSIQLGLLQQLAEDAGHRCESFHLNLELAAHLGFDAYEQLAHLPLPLLGEWLFTTAAFGPDAPDRDSDLLTTFDLERIEARLGMSRKQLVEFKQRGASEFIDDLVLRLALADFDVVGFSSVFQQTVPSIALAKRLKECRKEVVTIFGGANFQGEMGLELVKRLECIDWVSVGEADDCFPAFLNAVASGSDPAELPNIAGGAKSAIREPSLRPQLRNSIGFLFQTTTTSLRVRSSSSSHRAFGRTSICRSKHPGDVVGSETPLHLLRPGPRVNEVSCEVSRSRPDGAFRTSGSPFDRFGFSPRMRSSTWTSSRPCFRRSVERGIQLELFFEVKSNIGRDKLRVMRQAGVARIQPGIESLSTEVLSLMNKGVTGIQNINFLRWSRYYGFDVDWNLIWGFPGETAEAYEALTRITPLLAHLHAADNMGPVQMHRFSPMFRERGSLSPCAIAVQSKVTAMCFRGQSMWTPSRTTSTTSSRSVFRAKPTRRSRARSRHGVRVGSMSQRRISATDTLRASSRFKIGRGHGSPREYTLRGAVANLYAACSDEPLSLAQLHRVCSGTSASEQELEGAMGELTELGLVVHEGQSYLALALPMGAPT